MLSKEEKNYARKIVLVKDTINRMIDDLFDEVTVKGEFKEGVFEVNIKDFVNEILNEKLKSLFPYKFEDLKKGMWVWDSVKQICLKIKETTTDRLRQRIVICYSINESIYYPLDFEDNRFFPVQMANREVEEHERSGVYDL